MNANSTLGGSGQVDGDVSANDGRVAPGESAGTLRLGSLTLNNGSVLDFELGDPAGTAGTDSDLIDITGDLTLDGTLNVSALSGFGAGTYTLITYTGSLSDNTLSIGTLPAGYSAGLDTATDGEVRLVVTLNSYSITETANPSAGGSLSCSPNPVDYGASTTCNASPNTGYSFDSWGDACAGQGGTSCTLDNVTADATVTANFSLNSYSITETANPSAGGSLSCSPNPVDYGASTTCNASPNTGYSFDSWGDACAGQSGTSCTLDNVQAAKTVSATFTANSSQAKSSIDTQAAVVTTGQGTTITVTVRDGAGNPLSGISVSLSVESASEDGGAVTITTSPTPTDAQGDARFEVSSTVAQKVRFKASFNPDLFIDITWSGAPVPIPTLSLPALGVLAGLMVWLAGWQQRRGRR
ncbi:IPTL-CTERM sorting domain-containing protein [Halochromatium sp.]